MHEQLSTQYDTPTHLFKYYLGKSLTTNIGHYRMVIGYQ